MYRVVWVLKALWFFLSETINFLRNYIKLTFSGCPPKNSTIEQTSCVHNSELCTQLALVAIFHWTLICPFKILRRFEVVFWCLEWECCIFWKIDGNSFKSTNTIQCVPQKRKPINQVNFSENWNDLSEKAYIVAKFSLSSFFWHQLQECIGHARPSTNHFKLWCQNWFARNRNLRA